MNEGLAGVLCILMMADITAKLFVLIGIGLGDSDITRKDLKIVLIPCGFLYYIPVWIKHLIKQVKGLK